MALHGGMELQDEIRKAGVVPAGANPVRQVQEILRPGFITAVEYPIQSRGAQALALLLFQDPKGRGDSEYAGIFPKDRGAEGMDRADLGIAAEQDLTAKMRVVRITAKAGSDRVRDPGTEFTGGSTGKGDDQKAVDVFGPDIGALRVHIFHQPLGQDAGLAAACTGRDQDTAAAAADGLKLSICKIHYVSS